MGLRDLHLKLKVSKPISFQTNISCFEVLKILIDGFSLKLLFHCISAPFFDPMFFLSASMADVRETVEWESQNLDECGVNFCRRFD